MTNYTAGDREMAIETNQRCRRIETRLTRFLENEGLETGVQRPWWKDGKVMIPSRMSTIEAILKCIPEHHPTDVDVYLKEGSSETLVCTILPD